ncbi:hypothetical protein M2162_003064 [Streptomyces sp. SAI-041]|nr:hypothetical protein [Streptomyces sp. SAI-041]
MGAEAEAGAGADAEVAEPITLTHAPAAEPLMDAYAPDEELYSSVAEAEAAATRGRGRRRAGRRASTPAGAPRGGGSRRSGGAEAEGRVFRGRAGPSHSAAVRLSSVMPSRACSSSTIRRARSVSDTSIASGDASATALRRA